jgi:hypothetical protein
MLTDPLNVAFPSVSHVAAASSSILASISTFNGTQMPCYLLPSASATSVRKGSDAMRSLLAVMSVNHSQSKENPPYLTDRTSIRFDRKKVDPVSGKPQTLSAYSVFTLPQGGTFDIDDLIELATTLAMFTLVGGINASAGTFDDAVIGDTLRRLIQGEG